VKLVLKRHSCAPCLEAEIWVFPSETWNPSSDLWMLETRPDKQSGRFEMNYRARHKWKRLRCSFLGDLLCRRTSVCVCNNSWGSNPEPLCCAHYLLTQSWCITFSPQSTSFLIYWTWRLFKVFLCVDLNFSCFKHLFMAINDNFLDLCSS